MKEVILEEIKRGLKREGNTTIIVPGFSIHTEQESGKDAVVRINKKDDDSVFSHSVNAGMKALDAGMKVLSNSMKVLNSSMKVLSRGTDSAFEDTDRLIAMGGHSIKGSWSGNKCTEFKVNGVDVDPVKFYESLTQKKEETLPTPNQKIEVSFETGKGMTSAKIDGEEVSISEFAKVYPTLTDVVKAI